MTLGQLRSNVKESVRGEWIKWEWDWDVPESRVYLTSLNTTGCTDCSDWNSIITLLNLTITVSTKITSSWFCHEDGSNTKNKKEMINHREWMKPKGTRKVRIREEQRRTVENNFVVPNSLIWNRIWRERGTCPTWDLRDIFGKHVGEGKMMSLWPIEVKSGSND